LGFELRLIDVARQAKVGLGPDRHIDAAAARLNDDIVVAEDIRVLGGRLPRPVPESAKPHEVAQRHAHMMTPDIDKVNRPYAPLSLL
jgi:hypothetical protein